MSFFELLFAFLSVLLSAFGMIAFGMGIVLFIGLPVVPKVTGVGRWINRIYLNIATSSINRAAIVVSEHNDIYFKKMQFDSRGVEKVSFGAETKEFEDPDSALHYWMNIPFAMADEVSGVLFDPRHAALGQRKRDSDERDESSYPATNDEWEDYEVSEWIRGVFEMPKKSELVNLSHVRQLVDGGERSEYPKRVEELYKHSRDPFGSGLPILRFLMPPIAFLVTFGGMWLIVTRLGGGGSSGPDGTIEYGVLMLAISLTGIQEWFDVVDKKRAGAITALSVATLGVGALMLLLLGPMMTLIIGIIVGMGFFFLPIMATLCRPVPKLSGAFSRFFFLLGFLGYQRPVFEWTPTKYVLREYSDLDADETNVTWYGLFNSLVGFTYTPSEESWGAEVMDKDELESYQEVAVADGGKELETNIPNRFVRTNSMRRDSYGAFLPKHLKSTKYYLHSGIATARFKNSAVGEKSLRRLLQAKEKHGEGGSSISDKTVLYLTAAGGFFGAALGALVFLL